jgi:hypothetical protein
MKKFSEEHRRKMSEARKGKYCGENHPMYGKKQKRVICPHCDKEGGIGAMKRYHFDNCKFKIKKERPLVNGIYDGVLFIVN